MPSTSMRVAALLACAPLALAAPKTAAAKQAAATSIPAPPIRSHLTSISHGPYSGIPLATGALSNSIVGTGIPSLPPNPAATSYPSDGRLHDPQPAPYVPAGGVGTNGTPPVYNAKSDFDYQSLVRPSSLAHLSKDFANSVRLSLSTQNGSNWTCFMMVSLAFRSKISSPLALRRKTVI